MVVAEASTGASTSDTGGAGGGTVVMMMVAEASTGHTGTNTGTAESATDGPGLALKAIITFLAAGERTTLLLEVGHGHGRKGGGGVVLGLILVYLVDGNGGVHDGRLNGLLLDDRLNGPTVTSVDDVRCQMKHDIFSTHSCTW